MAYPQSSAPLRASAGTSTSGVIHVRTRLTADFTVIANALAQRRGSAVTVGVAAYILSLPTGAPVTIAALCEHFSEGQILISRALRELEADGYLERRRERQPSGHIRTRTYFYDVSGGNPDPDRPPTPPTPPTPRLPRKSPAAAKATLSSTTTTETAPAPDRPETPASLCDADPRAIAVLTSLRNVDPRLVLSEQEALRLAPAVAEWLAAGVAPSQITALLTARLPDHFLSRPVGILAFRLRETPLPAAPLRPHAVVQPFQTCDGGERAFRAADPGLCRKCRQREDCLPAAA